MIQYTRPKTNYESATNAKMGHRLNLNEAYKRLEVMERIEEYPLKNRICPGCQGYGGISAGPPYTDFRDCNFCGSVGRVDIVEWYAIQMLLLDDVRDSIAEQMSEALYDWPVKADYIDRLRFIQDENNAIWDRLAAEATWLLPRRATAIMRKQMERQEA